MLNAWKPFSKAWERRQRVKNIRPWKGWLKKGSDVIAEEMGDSVRDSALIAAAQRVEHYEMAGIGLRADLCQSPWGSRGCKSFEQTLQEEKEADELLGGIAEQINVAIPQGRNGNAKRTASTSGRRSRPAA
jgi:ferritin-like metal-binding protein YciE